MSSGAMEISVDDARSLCKAFLNEIKVFTLDENQSDAVRGLISLTMQVMRENTRTINKLMRGPYREHKRSSTATPTGSRIWNANQSSPIKNEPKPVEISKISSNVKQLSSDDSGEKQTRTWSTFNNSKGRRPDNETNDQQHLTTKSSKNNSRSVATPMHSLAGNRPKVTTAPPTTVGFGTQEKDERTNVYHTPDLPKSPNYIQASGGHINSHQPIHNGVAPHTRSQSSQPAASRSHNRNMSSAGEGLTVSTPHIPGTKLLSNDPSIRRKIDDIDRGMVDSPLKNKNPIVSTRSASSRLKKGKRRTKSHSNMYQDDKPQPACFSTFTTTPTDEELQAFKEFSILTTTKGKTNAAFNPNAKEKADNQDRGMIISLPGGYSVYGVFDGHGSEGHHCSDFVMEAFMNEIRRNFVERMESKDVESLTDNAVIVWMKQKFKEINESLRRSDIPCRTSGSTGTIAFYLKERVIVGYVGDSTAVLYNWSVESDGVRMLETPEHSPSAEQERKRIESSGGSVKDIYVPSLNKTISRIEQSGLSVSRAFGDFDGSRWGVSCQPEFVKFDLDTRYSTDKRMLLIIASDGLWDCVSPQEVIQHICMGSRMKWDDLERQAMALSKLGWDRRYEKDGRADDTTAVLAFLKPQ